MSFFKKMTGKIEDMMGDKDKKQSGSHGEGARNESYHPQQQPQYGNTPSYDQHSQQQQPFSQSNPQLPPGWISQWDQGSQRYYYLEQATGRTQWEMPQHQGQYGGGPPPQGYGGAPGQGGYRGGVYEGAPGYQGQGQYGQVHEKEKSKGHGGMLAAGAGGLAVGAVGGAVMADAMDDSDEERRAVAPQQGYGGGGYGDQQQPQMIPPPGGEISGSDRESIEEAREEYQEASSESDREEAREEYNEEVEEAYDD